MKKRCAEKAMEYIKNNSIIGLGGGSTIGYLIDFIKESGLNVKVVTPSFATEKLCHEKKIEILPLWSVNHIDTAFDGCDEIDFNLNALKSCGAIHTKEKIIGQMADEYILLADESKVSEKLTFKYPIVLEILKESIGYAERKIKELGGRAELRKNSAKDGLTISDSGLVIMDCFFENVKDIEKLHDDILKITGVAEISLFCRVVSKALIVCENGFKIISK